MLEERQEFSARKLVWVKDPRFERWGCSGCAWVFNPLGPPVGDSFDAMKLNFQMQLSAEFAPHDCVRRPLAKAANAS